MKLIKLAKEVGQYGVHVNCVSPGVIKTAVFEQLPREMLDRFIEKNILSSEMLMMQS